MFCFLRSRILHMDDRQIHKKNPDPNDSAKIGSGRFLSTGLPFKSLSFIFCIAHYTISTIVYETCEAIWKTLNEKFISFPTTSAFNKVEESFLTNGNFLNCIGAIDGKHVRVKAPSKSGTQYFNYKKCFSLHLQAVADANSKFKAVDVGEYGSCCDSGVFKSSTLFQLIQSNRLNIPPPKPLPGTRQDVPHVLIGDQGYPLKTFLLRPCPDSEDPAKLHFNELLSIARRCVECAFGILVVKWRCLKTELQVTPENVTLIVQTTCLLHNICMEFKESLPNPAKNTMTSDINYNRANNHSSHQAKDLRDYFKYYFFNHMA
ncbi:putative nuclease HARBI1 [Anopheles merus]|uniref:putative nuclease HARBI1 n=1 Tax=Anopheles merus TaxID=30066 RepID=UPI001BE42EE4|nr:putative nuclease HARBI1 [Anopheles merus]